MPKDKNAKAAKLIGSPEKLIGKMVSNQRDKKWVTDKITVSGPPHKQLQHTLVLKRLAKLIDAVEKSSGKKFTLASGEILQTEEETALPPALPAASLKNI
jgi:hypothetical protein